LGDKYFQTKKVIIGDKYFQTEGSNKKEKKRNARIHSTTRVSDSARQHRLCQLLQLLFGGLVHAEKRK